MEREQVLKEIRENLQAIVKDAMEVGEHLQAVPDGAYLADLQATAGVMASAAKFLKEGVREQKTIADVRRGG